MHCDTSDRPRGDTSHDHSAYLGAVLARACPDAPAETIARAIAEMQRAAARARVNFGLAGPNARLVPMSDAIRAGRRAEAELRPGMVRLEFTPDGTLLHIPGHALPIEVC